MWYRAFVVFIFLIGIVSINSASETDYSYKARFIKADSDCPTDLIYQKVQEDGLWWMYVYCGDSLLIKYQTDE